MEKEQQTPICAIHSKVEVSKLMKQGYPILYQSRGVADIEKPTQTYQTYLFFILYYQR